jgi:hypothetical protein
MVVAIVQAAKNGDEPTPEDHFIQWEREHHDGAEVEW